jgi:hypothetical protein
MLDSGPVWVSSSQPLYAIAGTKYKSNPRSVVQGEYRIGTSTGGKRQLCRRMFRAAPYPLNRTGFAHSVREICTAGSEREVARSDMMDLNGHEVGIRRRSEG